MAQGFTGGQGSFANFNNYHVNIDDGAADEILSNLKRDIANQQAKINSMAQAGKDQFEWVQQVQQEEKNARAAARTFDKIEATKLHNLLQKQKKREIESINNQFKSEKLKGDAILSFLGLAQVGVQYAKAQQLKTLDKTNKRLVGMLPTSEAAKEVVGVLTKSGLDREQKKNNLIDLGVKPEMAGKISGWADWKVKRLQMALAAGPIRQGIPGVVKNFQHGLQPSEDGSPGLPHQFGAALDGKGSTWRDLVLKSKGKTTAVERAIAMAPATMELKQKVRDLYKDFNPEAMEVIDEAVELELATQTLEREAAIDKRADITIRESDYHTKITAELPSALKKADADPSVPVTEIRGNAIYTLWQNHRKAKPEGRSEFANNQDFISHVEFGIRKGDISEVEALSFLRHAFKIDGAFDKDKKPIFKNLYNYKPGNVDFVTPIENAVKDRRIQENEINVIRVEARKKEMANFKAGAYDEIERRAAAGNPMMPADFLEVANLINDPEKKKWYLQTFVHGESSLMALNDKSATETLRLKILTGDTTDLVRWIVTKKGVSAKWRVENQAKYAKPGAIVPPAFQSNYDAAKQKINATIIAELPKQPVFLTDKPPSISSSASRANRAARQYVVNKASEYVRDSNLPWDKALLKAEEDFNKEMADPNGRWKSHVSIEPGTMNQVIYDNFTTKALLAEVTTVDYAQRWTDLKTFYGTEGRRLTEIDFSKQEPFMPDSKLLELIDLINKNDITANVYTPLIREMSRDLRMTPFEFLKKYAEGRIKNREDRKLSTEKYQIKASKEPTNNERATLDLALQNHVYPFLPHGYFDKYPNPNKIEVARMGFTGYNATDNIRPGVLAFSEVIS